MGALNLTLRIVLSVILVLGVLVFVSLYSFNQNVNEDNVGSVLGELGSDLVQEKLEEGLEEDSGGGLDGETNEFYDEIIAECEIGGEEEVSLGASGIMIGCAELEEAGPEGLGDLIASKIGLVVEEEIEEEILSDGEESSFLKYFSIIKTAMFFVGFVILVILAVLFFLTSPKSKFLWNLGVIGLVSGLPFLFVKSIDVSSGFGEIGAVNELADSIVQSLFVNFFYVFGLGFLVLIVGIVWSVIRKDSKPSAGEKESLNKK